jgi:exosortase/archaeosortase family protein
MTPAARLPGGPWQGWDFWKAIAVAAVTLFAGFLLIQTPPARAVFDFVAFCLAACATFILNLAGHDMVRTGAEIRDTITGHAVVVTSACDGSGLFVSLSAALVLLTFGKVRPSWAVSAATAIGSILLFNLLRILALFQAIGSPRLMSAEHLYVAPLLSAVLVAGLALFARRIPPNAPLRSAAIATALAVGWYFCRQPITCAAVVPLANGLLWLSPSGVAAFIACNGTAELTTNAPLHGGAGLLKVPFYPEDFTLALPLILASMALKPNPAFIVGGAIATLLMCTVGMTLAAITSGHDAAAAAGVSVLKIGSIVEGYRAPGPVALSLLKAVQDVVVHFNLFLLPIIFAVFPTRVEPDVQPAPAAGTPRRAGQRRRGR